MSHARKHVTSSLNQLVEPSESQSIVRIVDLRGGNICEVLYPNGNTVLAMIPAKFNRMLWIKKGNYGIVDREDEQSNSKVRTTLSNILTAENVKHLVKSNLWPSEFKDTQDSKATKQQQSKPVVVQPDSDEDLDDLMPANPNHRYVVDSEDEEDDEDEENEEDDE